MPFYFLPFTLLSVHSSLLLDLIQHKRTFILEGGYAVNEFYLTIKGRTAKQPISCFPSSLTFTCYMPSIFLLEVSVCGFHHVLAQ